MSNQSLIQAYKFYFANGGDFPNIIAARNFGQSVLGLKSKIDRTHRESKSLEESIESAVIELSRDIVATSTTSGEAFDRLLDLHDRQPILSTRTSRSMSQQAYSTPIPLGYAASCLAGIDENTTVYEPSAGHGALLLGANPTKVWVNEIFQQRADELSKIYSRVSLQDATNLSPGIVPKVDVVIANPPFGVVRGANGATQRWQVGKYVSTQIDHAIAWQALERLKDNGKAVLIVGAPMAAKLAKDDAALLEAYSSKDKTFFYQTLLASYKVTEHYQINGELYRKQGTDFPVDMIVIEGRGASKRSPPSLQAPTKIRDWNQLKEVFNSERRINTTIYLGSTSDGRRPGDAGEFLLDGGQQPTDRNQEPRPLPISNEGSVRSIGENRSGSDELSRGSPVDARSTEASRDITPILSRRVGRELGRSILPNDNLRERYADLSGMDATGRNFPSNNGSDNRPSEKDFSELSSSGLDGISDLPTNVYRLTELSNGDQTMATQDQQTQVSYAPLSKGQSLGTLIPLNMRDKTATALSNVEQYAGKPIDAWVAEQLKWSQEHLTSVLAAEQIDAVALAINNISKDEALIVGDQTGNGKGRVLAALMRYALVNDLGVMFITEKDDLYKDILRDCDNIGLNISPVATNNSLRIPLGNGTILRTGGKEKQDEIMQKIVEEGKLPSGNNAIFSTYSQMQTVQGKNTLRRDALKVLAPRSIVIMDESHNAGGSESNSYSKVGKPANRAEFARELVDLSIASIFSSATYAKNLTTLSLYTERTPLSKVVDGSDILIEMMGEGKVPLQQIVAAELAQSGHYIRRERSFEGIRFNNQELQVDTEVADKISAAMAAIVAFDKAKQEALNTVKGEMKAKGRYLQNDNATGESAIKSVNFTSLMHNVVGQSLLAQKVDGVIAASIEAIEKGQKPVIALSNTMGSIIEAYADEYDIQPGEDMNMDFSAVINRYLERSREYTVQSLVGTTRQRLNDEQLGIKAILLYEEAQERIQDLQNIGIPVSPIDYIKQGLATAGYRVGEITGRKHTLVYGDGLPRYAQRNGNETSKAAKIETIQQFNSGELDVVILNKSGSTGISLHSSETFSDRRPRHMILAQVDPDINIYLQMLGRVNRTGQINLPEYTIMTAGIPAEKRLTANLMRKMAALNANTTADRDSVHSVEGLDIFNFLGDQAAAQICAERPDLNAAMGLPIAVSEETDLDSIDLDGVILKVTGRIPLLPIEQQKEIYELIEGEYQVSLQRERAMGRDPLEAPNLDLKATTISKAEIMSKRDDLAGTMGASVDVRIMEVNVLEKPLSQIQMANRIANNIGKPIIEIDDLDIFDLMDAGRDHTYGLRTILDEEKRQYISRKTKPFEDIKKTELDADLTTNKVDKIDKEINRTTAKINANAATVSNYMRFYPIGTAVHLFYKGDNYAGVIGNYTCKKSAYANPVSPDRWKVQIFLADGAREIEVPLGIINKTTKSNNPSAKSPQITTHSSPRDVYAEFDEKQLIEKEERAIITGNIIRAYQFPSFRGSLVNFTVNDGSIETGILMPKDWQYAQSLEEMKVLMPDADKAFTFMQDYQATLQTNDGNLLISPHLKKNGQYTIEVTSGSNRTKYEAIAQKFNDEGFTLDSKKTAMVLMLNGNDTIAFIDRLYNDGHVLSTPDGSTHEKTRKLARDFLNVSVPEMVAVDHVAVSMKTSPTEFQEIDAAIEQATEQLLTIVGTQTGNEYRDEAVTEYLEAIEDELLETSAEDFAEEVSAQDISEDLAEVLDAAQWLTDNAIEAIDQYDTDMTIEGELEPPVTSQEIQSSFQKMQARFAAMNFNIPLVDRSQPQAIPDDELTDDPLFADLPEVEEETNYQDVTQIDFITPSRGVLMDFYKAALISEAPSEVVAEIVRYGQAQVAGIPDNLKTDDFIHPGVQISRAKHDEWGQMLNLVLSPSRSEITEWYIAAKMLKVDQTVLDTIINAGERQIAGTPEADKNARARDPDFRNPNFQLSWKEAESRSATIQQFLQPSRLEIIGWYECSKELGQDQDTLNMIKSIGERQIAGTPEEAKPRSKRDPNFVNPNFKLSWSEAKALHKAIGVALQPKNVVTPTVKGYER